MSNPFFDQPILNSPYAFPSRHWELDEHGQPTHQIIEARRKAEFVTPIPKARKSKAQNTLQFEDEDGHRDVHLSMINEVRAAVDAWRKLPNPRDWKVTPETARLLQHWRSHPFQSIKPFFCQVEAVETLIYLTEVAPGFSNAKRFLEYLMKVNEGYNPGLDRLSLKLATGAGKTTVMAMVIAWQTINAVRSPNSKTYTRKFLLIAPGITIKDRLRVLLPNDPDSYYASRELVPTDMLPEIRKAKIVITNYHSFMLREKIDLSKGGRRLLQGRGPDLDTLESEGEMIQRVMPELMGSGRVMVINDEAHHCYRIKPDAEDEELKGDERKEAEQNNEDARVWYSGIEAVQRKLGLNRVLDLSATPFFLNGSGEREGTLFPWTLSDFSLMDAIECGIVKLPRVPVADNIPGIEQPMFRTLWEHVGKKLPKSGKASAKNYDPMSIPTELQTALQVLYGHYEKTYAQWQEAKISVPPCFIVVCQNTSISKLVYEYISGFYREKSDGTVELQNGALPLFRNYDDNRTPYPRPNTLLIDSRQLEAGDTLDDQFRKMASDEIDRFKREIIERTGDVRGAESLSDAQLLREVMNTVGKPGQLGAHIRCVVSVSMLTEGWDANTVTHILGIRAFGTQLLCEQVIGRALRRQSYELNEEGLFNVEYADVFGIPFDFNAKPVVPKPTVPRETVRVHAVNPEREALEIRWPRVAGYHVELPNERLKATFGPDHILEINPEMIGATRTNVQGIVGEGVDMNLEHTRDSRFSTVVYEVTKVLMNSHFRDEDGSPKLYLFAQLKSIVREWMESYLKCVGGTFPAQLMYRELAEMASNRIHKAITSTYLGDKPVRVSIDPYNPSGSTRFVNFNTSKPDRWDTRPDKSHINLVILDSDWEAEFCRVVENHPRTLAYVKNHNMGFEVSYLMGNEPRTYIPDFIVKVDDGNGPDNPLFLVVEIKGYRREDAKEKKTTMESYWIPGVNRHAGYGRWAFAEFTAPFSMVEDYEERIREELDRILEPLTVSKTPQL